MPVLPDPRYENFAQALFRGVGQTDAHEQAGFKRNKGNAGRARRRKDVSARLAELQNGAADKAEIDKARVLAELGRIGFANMLDYMRVGLDGDPVLDFSALTREQAAALTEVTVEDFKDGRGPDARDVRRVKFKLADKRAALVDIGKHLGMFTEKHELTGKDGGPIEVAEITAEEAARRIAFVLARGITGK